MHITIKAITCTKQRPYTLRNQNHSAFSIMKLLVEELIPIPSNEIARAAFA
jgi:hypothetical protein